MKLYDENVIEEILKTIEMDEFDDEYQNEDAYSNNVSGWDALKSIFERRFSLGRDNLEKKILDIGCGSGSLFEYLPITHALEPNSKRYKKAVEKGKKYGIVVKQGVAETIPYKSNLFDGVLVWGTWTFLRSWDEALYEINRVLKKGGLYIFDFYTESTLPIAKVNNEKNLITRLRLFGFDVIERGDVLKDYTGYRRYLVVEKERDYDYRYFMLPQVIGKINNYLPERDWFMR